MSYLFISFAERLNKDNDKEGIYKDSLLEQYKTLSSRLPGCYNSPTFEDFFTYCLTPGLSRKFYISCPNFLREIHTSKETSFLNNVCLKLENCDYENSILPKNQSLILIGDIKSTSHIKIFIVKGFQLVDTSMGSNKDITSEAQLCIRFIFNEWNPRSINYDYSLLTNDFVHRLIKDCWTVDDPVEVRRNYEDWNNYLNFREYYLKEQSSRSFKLDSCQLLNAYAINKKEYKRHSSDYDDYILDDYDEFKKGEMVVLKSKLFDAVEYPLIKLTIDRNKKEFDKASVLKGKRIINDEERKIRRLASNNVFITQEFNQNNKFDVNILLINGFELGDKFKIIKKDVLPLDHIKSLDDELDLKKKEIINNIEFKFNKIITNEVNLAVDEKKSSLNEKLEDDVLSYQNKLKLTLLSDAKTNEDKEILKIIESKKIEILNKIKKETKKKKLEKDELKKIIDNAYAQIDVIKLYEDRNRRLVAAYRVQIEKSNFSILTAFKTKRINEIQNKYASEIRDEKNNSIKDLEAIYESKKNDVIENETITRFSLYFLFKDLLRSDSNKAADRIKKCHYIVFDSRAEGAKIKRQRTALNNFYSGTVKNPYLSTYLFSPKELKNLEVEHSEWTWFKPSLNEKQKEAVRKAVYSNGISLLQGPPGTGKTEVIAEIVGHLVRQGKKF